MKTSAWSDAERASLTANQPLPPTAKKAVHEWVGCQATESRGSDETALIEGRDRLTVLSESSDPNVMSYSYDDCAVAELDGTYYLCVTSGCSCPSPSETWSVELSSDSLDGLLDEFGDDSRTWIRDCILDASTDGKPARGA